MKRVLISMVNPGEPAEKGGLKAGDVILEFNGKKIKDVKSLQRTVADSAVESKATVKVWRDKKLKKFTVKLGELEKFNETAKKESIEEDVQTDEVELEKIGIRLAGLNNDTRSKYNIPKRNRRCCYCCKEIPLHKQVKCWNSNYANFSKTLDRLKPKRFYKI